MPEEFDTYNAGGFYTLMFFNPKGKRFFGLAVVRGHTFGEALERVEELRLIPDRQRGNFNISAIACDWTDVKDKFGVLFKESGLEGFLNRKDFKEEAAAFDAQYDGYFPGACRAGERSICFLAPPDP